MSRYSNLLARGFALLTSVSDPVSVTHAGVTKSGIATAIAKSQALKDTGYWLAFKTVVEFTREDFLALKLEDRFVVVITSADAQKTTSARVISIEGEENDGDPCVRVTFERADPPKK